jgi:hypothetical protein
MGMIPTLAIIKSIHPPTGCCASGGWNKILRALYVAYVSPIPGEMLRPRSGGEALVFGGGGAAR